MTNVKKWIASCIEVLKDYHVDVGNKHENTQIEKLLQSKTTIESEKFTIYPVQYAPSLDPCSLSEQQGYKCGLYKATKENKTVFKEFFFTPPDSRSPVGSHYVDIMSQTYVVKDKYACGECYFKFRTKTLIDYLKHTTIEVEFDIASTGGINTVSLIGLKAKANNKLCNGVLGFKYKIKNEQNEKYLLVSTANDKLQFFELNFVKESYIVDQKKIVRVFDIDDPVPLFIDIQDIIFKNEESDVVRLVSEFKNNIDTAFSFLEETAVFTKNIPIEVQRIEETIKYKNKEAKTKKLGLLENRSMQAKNFIFNNFGMIIGMALGLISFFGIYYLVNQESDDESEKAINQPVLL